MSIEMITAIIGFVAAFIINAAWDYVKKSKEDKHSELKADLKDCARAIRELTLALQRTEIEVGHLVKQVVRIPEIEKDLNLLGSKVRAMGNGHD